MNERRTMSMLQRVPVILAVTAAVQVYRAIHEERLMSSHDEEYARYMTTTKRFVPGVL